MKPDIIVNYPLYAPTLEALEAAFACHHLWKAEDRAGLLAAVGDKVRGVATFGFGPVRKDLIDALPRLEIVATMSIGYDHVDVAACRARGIAVTNTPDVLTEDVADIGIALLLAVARRICVGDRYVRGGLWPVQGDLPLTSRIGGATMGILGLGRIGLAVARRAAALGMRIVYHGPRRKPDASYPYYERLADMARDADYLMVTCPGGPETRGLVGAEVLAALGPKGTVINIARGSVVDQPALVAALVEGRLGGAGLDVFDGEPQVPEALFALENVVLLPHVGSATHATRAAMGQLMIDNLTAHFAGRPLLTPVT
jgi:lactate dehydrogenase-like 2-hydroxyacid dehydrogenase